MPVPAPPTDPLPADQQTVFDALAFMQAPINITRLAELLADHATARGTRFHGPELRQRLQDLFQSGLVRNTAQGQWWAEPQAGWTRFAALVRQPEARARWWASWRRLHRFDHSWHLELFGDEAMVGAVRVVVFAGGNFIGDCGRFVGENR